MLDCLIIVSGDQLADVYLLDFQLKQLDEFRIYENGYIKYLADIFNNVSLTYIKLYKVTILREITKFAIFDSQNYLYAYTYLQLCLGFSIRSLSILNDYRK